MTSVNVRLPVERSSENLYDCCHMQYRITEWSKFLILHAFHQPPFLNRHLHYYHHHHHHNHQHQVFWIWIILLCTWCNTPVTAKPDPPQPRCTKQSHFHPSQQSPIHRYQHAPSQATFTATYKTRSTDNSSHPVKPVSPLPSKPDPPLPAKLVSPLPAKPDPPLTACSQRSQFHPYHWSQIHCYQQT